MSTKKKRPIIWVGFIAYMLVLVKLVLLKNPRQFVSYLIHWNSSYFEQGKKHLVLTPFQTTWICLSGKRGFEEALENVGGNLLLFIPMGFLLPMLFASVNTGKKVIVIAFAISLFFELTQLFTGTGYCDIDDLMQNSLGAAIGYWAYKKWITKQVD